MVYSAPIVVDGSYGEGGGALLRTAVSMSALTQQPLKLSCPRGGTKFAGLNAEDLVIIRAAAKICGAETTGLTAGSHEFSFLPTRRVRALRETLQIEDDDGALGHPSAPVVLATLLPILAGAGAISTVTAIGETHGHGVLSYDAFTSTTIGAYRRMGLYAYPDLIQGGFGRGSLGEVRLEIEPSATSGLKWPDRGRLLGIRAAIVTSELDGRIAERAISHLSKLTQHAGLEVAVDSWTPSSATPGAYVAVWAEYERGFGSGSACGARGVRMESVVQQAFESFVQWNSTNATVDSFLADQLIVGLAMAEGDSVIEVDKLTPRLLTAIWVIKQFLPIRITVKGHEGEPGTVTIRK